MVSANLTVAQVSGIIAAAIAVVGVVFPNAVTVVLVAALRKEHTAVTWSVVQRNLMASLWPTILSTEAAATGHSVSTRARSLVLGSWLGSLLIALAAVTTPLGLHEAVVATASDISVPFADLVDPSPMGYGTPPRSSFRFTRSCGSWVPEVCPGSNTSLESYPNPDYPTMVTNVTVHGTYDNMVPRPLITVFQSGLNYLPRTVSSFFDIQTRQYSIVSDSRSNDGKPYLVDSFRVLESLVLNDAVEAKEGLIVDTQQGRIAFRHHTAPEAIDLAAEWAEDLLFLEPVTECVDTNLTLEFRVADFQNSTSRIQNLTLIDNGGFYGLNTTYPGMERVRLQEDPQLRYRAYRAAWNVNAYTMAIMNVTRMNPGAFSYIKSKLGQRFELDEAYSQFSINSIQSSHLFDMLLDPETSTKRNHTNSITNETCVEGIYDNPFNITEEYFFDITTLCQAQGGADIANSTDPFVACGLVLGAPRRVDGIETLISRPGDTYQQAVYTCASVARASVKSVHLRFNATQGNSVKALSVLNVTDKAYTDSSGSNPPPLWGIETSDLSLSAIQQLWGLFDESYTQRANLSTLRAPHLLLPGFSVSTGPSPGGYGYEYIPGATAPQAALTGMYSVNTGSSAGMGGSDYSGQSNLAMFKKWQDVGKDAAGMARVLNLIWTDIAANSMLGTRGWGTGNVTDMMGGNDPGELRKRQNTVGSDADQAPVMVPVRLYERKTQYHWVYGIPAAMVALMFAVTLVSSCVCLLLQAGAGRIRYFLNHLSAGRLLAEQEQPDLVSKQAPTKIWLKMAGTRPIALRDTHELQAGAVGQQMSVAASSGVSVGASSAGDGLGGVELAPMVVTHSGDELARQEAATVERVKGFYRLVNAREIPEDERR